MKVENKKIYLVKGSTGEWEDHYKWTAKAFFNKDKAEALCKQLNTIAKKSHAGNFGSNSESRNYDAMYKAQEKVQEELNKIDPQASVNFPGTSYSIEELEVEVE